MCIIRLGFLSAITVTLCVIVVIVLFYINETVNIGLLRVHAAFLLPTVASTHLVSARKHFLYMRHRDGMPLSRCVDLCPRPDSRYAILVEYIGHKYVYLLSALKLGVRLHLYLQSIRHETDLILEIVREVPPLVTDADVVSALRAGYDQVCHTRPIDGGLYNRFGIFNMTQYESVLYLDSDIIPVNDVSDLIRNGTLALQAAGKHVMWAHEIRADWFNAGVMLVLPNPDIFNQLMGLLQKLLASGHIKFINHLFGEDFLPYTNKKDQAILNHVFHAQKGNALRMPEKYNALLFELTDTSEEVLRYAHLIHFIDSKPWKDPNCYLKYNYGRICNMWFETPTVLSQVFLDAHSAYAPKS